MTPDEMLEMMETPTSQDHTGWRTFDLSPAKGLDEIRRALGRDEVLTLSQAALRLPMDACAAIRWFKSEGLVRKLDGRNVIIWGDVLDKLQGGGSAATGKDGSRWQPVKCSLPRVKL